MAAALQISFAFHHRGIRPSRACAERLTWFECDRIDQLTAEFRKDGISLEFLQAAKSENPARIAEMRRQLADAIRWETARYGDSARYSKTLSSRGASMTYASRAD